MKFGNGFGQHSRTLRLVSFGERSKEGGVMV